jgi:mannan endo-1,4-beta-mannosidase
MSHLDSNACSLRLTLPISSPTMRHTRGAWIAAMALIPFFSGCGAQEGPSTALVDPAATAETQALFANLNKIRHDHTLYGHEDDLAYGVLWRGEAGRSDILETAGSYPAVYGWDIGWIELDSTANLDNVDFEEIRGHIRDGYERGGVITISWHLNNPVTGGSSWDNQPTVKHILPGGSHHELFLTWMDRLAAYLGSLKASDGTPIPVIFRPWHEHTGSWFWWSASLTEGDEYVRLWRFTVEYLRDVKGMHNLLYAYSPSNTGFETMWETYPGDEWVDILGYDDYFGYETEEQKITQRDAFAGRIQHIVTEAEKRGKIPAITETGLEAMRDHDWFTDFLLHAIKQTPEGLRIAYVLTWRNSNDATDRKDHFYAPYAGHPSAENMMIFREDPMILFEADLPDLYGH